MTLDATALQSVAAMTDEIGVLSIYANADPREEHTRTPAWHKRVHGELAEVKRRVKANAPRATWLAVNQRLHALSDELEWLFDRSEPGQGRALFAAAAADGVERVSVQVPLIDRAVLDTSAHLVPLMDAWSSDGPAGVVAVGADSTRIVDLRFGSTSEPANIRYEPGPDSRELKGPAAAHPGLAQHSAPQHDLHARREGERLVRQIRSGAADVAAFAAEYGWEYVVVTGETTLTQAVIDGLPAGFGPEIVQLDHPVRTLTPPKLAALVGPALSDARRRRSAALAQRACEDAMSGNAGACGLAKTLAALQDRRVARLLLVENGAWRGVRTADGRLAPAGQAAADDRLEPYLDERMVELALGEGAGVTMLDADSAAPLEDGVGAILRW